MRKLFFAFAVISISLFSACGNTAEQDAAAAKARQEAIDDSIAKVEAEAKAAAEAAAAEAAAMQDTTQAAPAN